MISLIKLIKALNPLCKMVEEYSKTNAEMRETIKIKGGAAMRKIRKSKKKTVPVNVRYIHNASKSAH